jgi:predicted Zn-dependent protease
LKVLDDEFDSPPDDPWLLALASECNWSMGREKEARPLLASAEESNPDERQVLLLKARIQMETGDPEAAIDPLRRHLQNDRHDFECRYRLALLYQRLGRSHDYERESALMLASQKLRNELNESSDRAVEEPRNAEVRERIAEICERLDKPELAAIYRTAARACRQMPSH